MGLRHGWRCQECYSCDTTHAQTHPCCTKNATNCPQQKNVYRGSGSDRHRNTRGQNTTQYLAKILSDIALKARLSLGLTSSYPN